MLKQIFAFALLLILAHSCNDKYPIDQLPDDTTPPSLSNPFLSFSSTLQFIAFGDSLNGELCKGYWFQMTDSNQSVLSACSGKVTSITDYPNGAKSIAVKYKTNSIYSFVYSELRNVQVNVNDVIGSGTILGKTGNGGKLFFQIIKNNNEVLCPKTFGSPGFNIAIEQAISRHNTNYPSHSITDPCFVQTLPK